MPCIEQLLLFFTSQNKLITDPGMYVTHSSWVPLPITLHVYIGLMGIRCTLHAYNGGLTIVAEFAKVNLQLNSIVDNFGLLSYDGDQLRNKPVGIKLCAILFSIDRWDRTQCYHHKNI